MFHGGPPLTFNCTLIEATAFASAGPVQLGDEQRSDTVPRRDLARPRYPAKSAFSLNSGHAAAVPPGRFRAKRRHCAPAGNERGRQLRRPYFLSTGLPREARKVGYNILNPIILLFLRDSIGFDAVVQ
jgi:hypothetical protein